jgi:Bacterial CdiA-CT RNAse A domain
MQLAGVLLLSGCDQTRPPENVQKEEARDARAAKFEADRYDLSADERRGGHTLARHVGRGDEQLRERLASEGNIAAASSWSDQAIAEETVAAALRAEHSRLESWRRRGERRPNLALHFDAGRVIGRSLRRGSAEPVNCTNAVVVIRADGPEGFYVLTSYPEGQE